MEPTSETDGELVYGIGAATYRLSKTNPPVLTFIVDFGHEEQVAAGRPQTWAEAKALFDEA